MELENKFGLEKKIVELSKRGGRAGQVDFSQMEKAALYDLNGTLVGEFSDKGWEYFEEKLKALLEPIKKDDEKTFNLVLEKIRKPKRGTKAREVYYDFLEMALEKKAIIPKAFGDVFLSDNSISRDMKENLKIISLSRGTDSLLDKIVKAGGLSETLQEIHSTIPYGGEKTAECYFEFFLDCLKRKQFIVKSYEDEFGNLQNMFCADVALALKLNLKSLPFKIIWVNRKKENRKKEIEELERVYSGILSDAPTAFSEVFSEVSSLR